MVAHGVEVTDLGFGFRVVERGVQVWRFGVVAYDGEVDEAAAEIVARCAVPARHVVGDGAVVVDREVRGTGLRCIEGEEVRELLWIDIADKDIVPVFGDGA